MAFNSREYEWADITLLLGGVDITGIRGIKYKEEIEREHLHAKGRNAHSIQSGNVTVSGEITLLQSELDALIKQGNGSIIGLALDAEINYGNPPSVPTTDRVLGIRFTEYEKGMDQNDKFMEITLPFLALKVQNNV